MKTLAFALLLTFAAGLSAEVQKKDVDIQAPDGLSLKGTFFSAGRVPRCCCCTNAIWIGMRGMGWPKTWRVTDFKC